MRASENFLLGTLLATFHPLHFRFRCFSVAMTFFCCAKRLQPSTTSLSVRHQRTRFWHFASLNGNCQQDILVLYQCWQLPLRRRLEAGEAYYCRLLSFAPLDGGWQLLPSRCFCRLFHRGRSSWSCGYPLALFLTSWFSCPCTFHQCDGWENDDEGIASHYPCPLSC